MSSGEIVYSLSRDYVADERDETITAIMGLSTGEVFKMEHSAGKILYLFTKGQTLDQVVSHIHKMYDVDHKRALNDVVGILEQFLSMGTLQQAVTVSDDTTRNISH